MLNPGIPDLTDHIADIIADLVRRYDVDGVHFDDMFYPYPEGAFAGAGGEDLAAFRRREDASIDLKTWRRDNINRMIRTVNDRIKSIKPFVRFGVSPFGIWRSGVDYLTPQLYWKVGGRSDYRKLLEWWAEKRPRSPQNLKFVPKEGRGAGHILSWDDPNPPASVWKHAVL